MDCTAVKPCVSRVLPTIQERQKYLAHQDFSKVGPTAIAREKIEEQRLILIQHRNFAR